MKRLTAFLVSVVILGTAAMPISAEELYPGILPGGCEVIPGDINFDGELNLLDIVIMQRWLVGSGSAINLYAADMNFDDRVNVSDLALMKQSYLESLTTYYSAEYYSPDSEYHILVHTAMDYRNHSEITVKWYDPDGDYEKTDTFEVTEGAPFTSGGEWDGIIYSGLSFALVWNEDALTMRYDDDYEGTVDEVILTYPDRTRTMQSVYSEIGDETAPEVTGAEVSAMSYGDIERKVSVRESGYVAATEAVGRVGRAVSIETDDSIDEYTVTLHYDESELRWVPEGNLFVLGWNMESPSGYIFTVEDAVHDMEANTFTFTADKDCDFALADIYQHKKLFSYSYEVEDITAYVSDWERNGDTADIMELADKEWAKENLQNRTFYVSTKEELASAVYYINATRSLEHISSSNPGRLNITITADIDLAGCEWAPIESFSGVLDGGGHTISRMYINSYEENAGFIGASVGADIKDITFEDASVVCHELNGNAGIVAGKGVYTTSFTNVHVSGIVRSQKTARAGGLLGYGKMDSTDCTEDVEFKNFDVR